MVKRIYYRVVNKTNGRKFAGVVYRDHPIPHDESLRYFAYSKPRSVDMTLIDEAIAKEGLDNFMFEYLEHSGSLGQLIENEKSHVSEGGYNLAKVKGHMTRRIARYPETHKRPPRPELRIYNPGGIAKGRNSRKRNK